MRRLLLVLVLAACGSHGASTGPTWPKLHEAEADGGESLEPHESKQVAAAIEKDSTDEAKPAPAESEAKPAAPAAAPEVGTPAATPPAATEESVTTDEIIIDVDD